MDIELLDIFEKCSCILIIKGILGVEVEIVTRL